MSTALVLTAAQLIVLHTLGGNEVVINPAHVTHLFAAKPGEPNKQLAEGVRCMINFDDGKFVSVSESCDVVRKLMEEVK